MDIDEFLRVLIKDTYLNSLQVIIPYQVYAIINWYVYVETVLLTFEFLGKYQRYFSSNLII